MCKRSPNAKSVCILMLEMPSGVDDDGVAFEAGDIPHCQKRVYTHARKVPRC